MQTLLNLIEIDINLITAKGAQGGAKPTLLSLLSIKQTGLGRLTLPQVTIPQGCARS